jgi:hypothetical protein
VHFSPIRFFTFPRARVSMPCCALRSSPISPACNLFQVNNESATEWWASAIWILCGRRLEGWRRLSSSEPASFLHEYVGAQAGRSSNPSASRIFQ